jgi:N-acetylmuramoyl-L-alanine amidase
MGVSVVMAGGRCLASSRRPDLARKAYLHAVELQRKLEARPARYRKAADYERVIREFRNVYIYDFAYTKAPVAAQSMGDLYAEMGRLFSSPDDYQAAIKAYQYVISQYPISSMARDAALSVGNVYLNGLNDPAQAADAFRSFLEKHPSSPGAEVARKNLKKIADKLAAQQESPPSGNQGSADNQTSNGLVEVTEIHDWAGPNYTRVVIGAQGPFKYNTLRLSNPDRIVFDLPNTHLSHSLLKKNVPINGDFLHDIRVGQFKPDVTRIVLDVKNIQDYSAFPLPNPFRLIIDVHGSSPEVAKHSPERATPAPCRHRSRRRLQS